MKTAAATVLMLVAGTCVDAVRAQDLAAEVAELRQLLGEVRNDYEARIDALEARLARAEALAGTARREASEAFEVAEQTAIGQTAGTRAANTFNPALGAVLYGRYASLDRGWEEIPGFQPAGEIGTGEAGFALSEAEVNLKASVDANYFGNLTFALHDEDGEVEVELEEAWLQTTALPAGITLTGGRFFSAAGYLNKFHRHADDFADRPLPYQAFFGGRYGVDGIQARWLAPTPVYFELGTELNWGGTFPATRGAGTSPGAWTLFAKLGGDVGVSHSWQLGLSRIETDAIERGGAHHHDEAVEPETFSGDSDLSVFDFVWKWAPGGNPAVKNLKLQGEYFSRSESGVFGDLAYAGDQTGWYLQGVWQFAPRWRIGLRHGVVDADNGPGVVGTELEDPGRDSSRDTLMLDFSPSEYSRLRLQYANDRVLAETDRHWQLQYIMSVGAHAAHEF